MWTQRGDVPATDRSDVVDAATSIADLALGQGRQFQSRALAAMYGAGGALGLVSVLVPHGHGVNEAAWAINSALGLPVALALFIFGGRVTDWALHSLLAIGAAMVALGMLFGDGGPASVATSFFFVWIALYVAWFFSLRVVATHLVGDSALFGLVLLIEDAPAGPAVWLLVMGTAGVVAAVVTLMHRELIRVATLDALTGLPTRYALDDALSREISRAHRSGLPLCLAIMDVDGLKAVNDHDGHQAGDRVLAEAAQAWREALRKSDVLVRFGGDEFVAVLPECPPEVAHEVLARVRNATAIAFSVGFAWWQDGDAPSDLLGRADAELYQAKRTTHRDASAVG